MKTLVLGGSSFVGLHLVYELLRRGHEVTVFNRGQTPVEFPTGVKRLYGDRKDHNTLEPSWARATSMRCWILAPILKRT